jgi:hypothetical protein
MKAEKRAIKNSLQFFAGLLFSHFKENKSRLPETFDISAIVNLKLKPSLFGFSRVLQVPNVKAIIAEFLLRRKLWYKIVKSKMRGQKSKIVCKKVIGILTHGFLRKKLTRLLRLKN